jgi:hypothetical protein
MAEEQLRLHMASDQDRSVSQADKVSDYCSVLHLVLNSALACGRQ